MFQSNWNRINVEVFFSLIFAMGIIFFTFFQTNIIAKTLQFVFGFYLLLFPVGWLFMLFLFPKPEEISLLARFLFSIASSIALNNLSLLAVFFLLKLPLNFGVNLSMLLIMGSMLFYQWYAKEIRVRK